MTRRPPIGRASVPNSEVTAPQRAGHVGAARPGVGGTPTRRVRPLRGSSSSAAASANPRVHPATRHQPVIDITSGVPTIDLTDTPVPDLAEGAVRRPAPHGRPVAALPRIVPLSILLAAVVGLSGLVSAWTTGTDGASRVQPQATTAVAAPAPTPADAATASAADSSPTARSAASAPGSAQASTSASLVASQSPPSVATAQQPATATGLSAADIQAGLTSLQFPDAGSGRLVTVAGERAAEGKGTVRTFRVQVERGLPIDGTRFADFVYTVLNDPKGWGAGGRMTFARTDGASDFRIVLASPQTSAAMCRPLRTRGTLSCRQGNAAILTVYRWAKGTADYGTNLTGYRQYLVNHEVGHYLGHHQHLPCPGPGRPAPVMMQQTKGLKGCTQNPWPNP